MSCAADTCSAGGMPCPVARLALLAFLALISCPAMALAEETAGERRAAVAREIRETVEELQAVRQQLRLAADRHARRLESLDKQISALKSELDALTKTVDSQRREISESNKIIEDRAAAAAAARDWISKVAASAGRFVARARDRGAQSDGRFDKAARLLTEPNSAAERQAGLRALFSALGEQWLAARTVTLTNEEVRLNGGQQQKHAWVVRFGLAARIFLSEDGDLVGAWSGKPGSPWRLDLSEATQKQIREVMGVVREQRPPSITPLPAPIAPSPAGGNADP